jgi:hypothetical protein
LQTISPNGNFGLDAAISVVAHELAETVTDPFLNAWNVQTDSELAENCDLVPILWSKYITYVECQNAKIQICFTKT